MNNKDYTSNFLPQTQLPRPAQLTTSASSPEFSNEPFWLIPYHPRLAAPEEDTQAIVDPKLAPEPNPTVTELWQAAVQRRRPYGIYYGWFENRLGLWPLDYDSILPHQEVSKGRLVLTGFLVPADYLFKYPAALQLDQYLIEVEAPPGLPLEETTVEMTTQQQALAQILTELVPYTGWQIGLIPAQESLTETAMTQAIEPNEWSYGLVWPDLHEDELEQLPVQLFRSAIGLGLVQLGTLNSWKKSVFERLAWKEPARAKIPWVWIQKPFQTTSGRRLSLKGWQ